MKVGVFLSNFDPKIGGGYTFEWQIIQSILEIADQTHHQFFLLSFESQLPPDIRLPSSIKFVSLSRFYQYNFSSVLRIGFSVFLDRVRHAKIRFSLKYLAEIQSLINQEILDAHGIEMVWSTATSCLTHRIPYITTVWDLEHRLQPYFPEINAGVRWDIREYLNSLDLQRATFVVTGTKAGKAEIERFYQVSPERIRVIPFATPQLNQIGNLPDRETVMNKYQLPDRYLFYPAQFWPHKNHINLLLALKLLRDKFNLDLSLVLTGSDPDGRLTYLQSTIAELGLTDRVKILGFVSQAELVVLYQNAFALTFVSFFGPDNIPPLEAFALGCPVVAAKVAGAEEQLGDAALLVDPKDEEQIALAIASLYTDPDLRHSLIDRGRTRASKWTRTDYLQQVLTICDEFEKVRRCWNNNILKGSERPRLLKPGLPLTS
jgi:glycosyltransferase involved in cell wall biosynthesis